MTKKIATGAIAALALFAATGLAQANGSETRPFTLNAPEMNIHFFGEMKTGVFWDNRRLPQANIHHNDYAGPEEGRLRLGLRLNMRNFGIRTRITMDRWGIDLVTNEFRHINWDYAFAYVRMFDNQLRLHAGNLSDSPWRAGGPDIWQALDHLLGMRVEIWPSRVPGLVFGLSMTEWNAMTYFNHSLIGFITEATFGAAYTNAHVHAAFGWRLDGTVDVDNHYQEGQSLMYRIEARFLSNMVPGLRVWANGWWQGIAPALGEPQYGISNHPTDDMISYRNWLYAEYVWGDFLFDARINLEFLALRSHFMRFRPGIFYRVLPNLRVGGAFHYQMNFGPRAEIVGVPFVMMGFEPEVRFWFGGGSYLALVSRYYMTYDREQNRRDRTWLNLRAVIAF